MNIFLTQIGKFMLAQSWQIAVLVLIVAGATFLLRKASAHVRYLLWLIVLAKCLIPPFYGVPLRVLPSAAPDSELLGAPLSEMPSALDSDHTADSALTSSHGLSPQLPPAESQHAAIGQTEVADEQILTWARICYGLGLVWLAGMCLYLAFNALRALRTHRWLQRIRRPLPLTSHQDLTTFFSGHGFARLPKIWLADDVSQPFVWGLVKGSIYLPSDFLHINNSAQQYNTLAHELSHIVRFDAAINSLQVIAQGMFWFHPFVWWANLRMRREREKCCDEMAVAGLQTRPEEYGTAVLETLRMPRESTRPVPSLAIAGPARNLEERIRAMMTPGKTFHKYPGLLATTLTISLALLVVPTSLVLTADAQTETTPETSMEKSIEAQSTLLYEAALAGDLDAVKRLITQGADINTTQGDKALTPLHLAASKGHAEVVRALLAKGANVNVVDADGNTALISAIYSQNGEGTVNALIEGGIDVNKGPQDSQPLNNAIWMLSTGMVEALLDAGAKTDVKDSGGWTPLHYAAFMDTRNNEMLELFLDKTKQPDTIYLAAYRGDLEAVKTYISSGVDVNAKDSGGCTPLLWAVRHDSPEVVEYLIAQGAEINATVGNLTPLLCANSLPVVELLVSKGAAINTNGQKMLHKACRMGDKEIATFLLSKGADVNAKSSAGRTPLLDALSFGHPDLVPLLVANGADVNAADSLRRTPVSIAIKGGYTEIVSLLRQHGAKETLFGAVAENDIEEVKRLIAKGADINAKNDSGATPLQWAAAGRGMDTMVKLLIANGADTEARTPSGLTPLDLARHREHATGERTTIVNMLREHGAKGTLHGAACLGDIDEVKRLLDEGADINAKSESGWTPLHWAVSEGHESVVELLVARGADINAQFRLGGTPLSFAAIKGQKDMVEFLLAKGADINTGTPLVGAAANGHTAVVELLLAKGADVNLKYNDRTALDLAKEKNHMNIVELLHQHGATE